MEKIGPSIDNVLEKYGFKKQLRTRKYLSIWEKIVGRKIAQYTKPLTIDGKKLLVEVNDSIWLYHLTMLKEKIIKDFNNAACAEVISEIKFINTNFISCEKFNPKKQKVFQDKELVNNNNDLPELNEDEMEKIKKALLLSPVDFRHRLEKLLKKTCLYQKSKMNTNDTLKETQSFHCIQEVIDWKKTLRYFFCHTPWVKYEYLLQQYPALDYKVYQICKADFLERYHRRIFKLLKNKPHRKELRIKVLRRLAQRYILLLTEKEPAWIEKKDIYETLKCFPGLYSFVYG